MLFQGTRGVDMTKPLRDVIIEEYKNVSAVAAHDIKHVLRVAGLARTIAQGEGYDPKEAEAAALLHDVGRFTHGEEDHAKAGEVIAREKLDRYTQFPMDVKERILSAICQHSQRESEGVLAHILQDADKLDGLGNIGIVRAYMSKSHLIDYPEEVVVKKGSRNAKTVSEQVAFQMEWYGMLYTKSARAIGKPRYERMQQFMDDLKEEIGESK